MKRKKVAVKSEKPVLVTEPFLPPLSEFQEYLKAIWESRWLTNNGKFHKELEAQLCAYLGVPYISLFSNGTLALITALQTLRITGEVITTPFSFVATTHSLWWNNIKPVFVDIEPEFCNLDPEKIESAITPQTTAILPVHVYGNPCKVDEIQRIADVYGLKVIYDAAHAFGVKINGRSVFNYGDLSVLSFHATKVFNTFEGGAIVCHDERTKKRIDYLKNFGFAGEITVIEPGINAKMNEVQAAMGLLQLKHHAGHIARRKAIFDAYREGLKDVNGISFLGKPGNTELNYSYFPVFVDKEKYALTRDQLYDKLKQSNIYGRRYFYPLISEFSTYRRLPSAKPENLPNAAKAAEQVICLPIHAEMKMQTLHNIMAIVRNDK